MRPEIHFLLPRGLDSIPVPVEPYETLIGRCHHALFHVDGESVKVVRMSRETEQNLVKRSYIDYVYDKDIKLSECFTFLGRKIDIERD